MAMPQSVPFSFSAMSENISIEELAAFFDRSVLTVKKWFDRAPGVVRIPRGGQKPTILVPPEVLRNWMKDHGLPDEAVDAFLAAHRAREARKATEASPAKSRELKKSADLLKVIEKPIKAQKVKKAQIHHKVSRRAGARRG